jgi:hypothetical protein
MHVLRDLLPRPWWSRIWIIQDCVLPFQATIFYGPIAFEWRMMLQASLAFEVMLLHAVNITYLSRHYELKTSCEKYDNSLRSWSRLAHFVTSGFRHCPALGALISWLFFTDVFQETLLMHATKYMVFFGSAGAREF